MPEAGGRGNGDLAFNGHRVPVWDDEKVLNVEMDGGDSHTM